MLKHILIGATTVGLTINPTAVSTSVIPTIETDLSDAKAYIEEYTEILSNYPDYELGYENLNTMNELYEEANLHYEIMKYYDGKTDELRYGATSMIINPDFLETSINNLIEEIYTYSTEINYFNGYYDLENWRKDVVEKAISAEGKISYDWGIKPTTNEWNNDWTENKSGLDCSGFVCWSYWDILGYCNKDLYSTLSISSTQKEITYEELLPGDLGMILDSGTYYTTKLGNKYFLIDDVKTEYYEYLTTNELMEEDLLFEDFYKTHTNHVGIYVGKDKNGNDLWVHCKGNPENTVVIDNYDNFNFYYQVTKGE